MPRHRPTRQPERRAEVLHLLRKAEAPLSIAAIAAAVGVHRNTARFHLENLVQTGQVKRAIGEPTGQGRPPQLFRIAEGWDPNGPRGYLHLAEALLEHVRAGPRPAADALDAGYRWGQRLVTGDPGRSDADSTVLAMWRGLDRLGFHPEQPQSVDATGTDPGGHRIDLLHCPFLELADRDDDLICRLHLGMLRGAVDRRGTPLTVDLDPKVEPSRCVVRLHRRQAR